METAVESILTCVPGATWDSEHQVVTLDCPYCGSKDYFSFRPNQGGSCAVCDRGAADEIELICRANKWKPAEVWSALSEKSDGRPVPPPRVRLPEVEEQGDGARSRYLECLLADAGPSSRIAEYLEFRGLEGEVPDGLLLHSGFPYYDKRGRLVDFFPTILAPLRTPSGGLSGLYLTHLDWCGPWLPPVACPQWTFDGSYAWAEATSPAGHASACRGATFPLTPAAERLGIAVGLETSVCVWQVTQRAVWMVSDLCALCCLDIPAGVSAIDLWLPAGDDFRGCWNDIQSLMEKGLEMRVMWPFQDLDWLAMKKTYGEEIIHRFLLGFSVNEMPEANREGNVTVFLPRAENRS